MSKRYFNITKRGFILGATLLASAILPASAQQLTKVRIEGAPIADGAAAYLGDAKGIFAKHGIELVRSIGQSGAATVASVVSGAVDVSGSALVPLLTASSRNVPIRIIAAQSSATLEDPDFLGVIAKPDGPIKSFKDLGGKTVAINALRNFLELTLKMAVKADGGDPTSIKFIEIGFPEMQGLLERGAVDAAYAVEPFVTRSTKKGMTAIGYPSRVLGKGTLVGAYFTSAAFAEKNPQLLAKLIDAITESQAYASAHPDEVRDIILTYTKLTKDDVAAMTLPRYDSKLDVAAIERTTKAMLDFGMISKSPDLKRLIHTR